MSQRKINTSLNADIEAVLATRHDNGDDFWTTPDGRLGVGGPFSTLQTLFILYELGVPGSHEVVQGATRRVLDACLEDGRFRVAPRGTIYPCHVAIAAAALGRYVDPDVPQLAALHHYLLENRWEDGGWRCRKFSGGRGPETEHSNPGVTLFALDAFRFTSWAETRELDAAVETLLDHWTIRRPIGPCHFGIGTLFMQVEYPFLRYNLFYYVYVLSFYARARQDPRFIEAWQALREKRDPKGRLIVERPNRRMAKFWTCAKGLPSEPATRRCLEIEQRLAGIDSP